MRADPPVVVVGRGRMGATFLHALREAGVPCDSVAGRARHRGRRPFDRRAPMLWLLAVTDRAVASTCSELVDGGWILRHDAVCHLAGLLSTEPLESARRIGASRGAAHPLVAVADRRRPPPLRGAAVSFEGDRRALTRFRALARHLEFRLVHLASADRARYHAAAALMATGSVALAQGAADLWSRAVRPFDDRVARTFAASLLRSVAHNVAVSGVARALASPLMRGDVDAIAKHLAAMKSAPSARALYAAAVAQVLTTLAAQHTLSPALVRKTRAMLRGTSRQTRA